MTLSYSYRVPLINSHTQQNISFYCNQMVDRRTIYSVFCNNAMWSGQLTGRVSFIPKHTHTHGYGERKREWKEKNKLARALWFLFFSCPCFLFLRCFFYSHEFTYYYYYIYWLVTACYACHRIIYGFQRFFTPAYKIPIKIFIFKITKRWKNFFFLWTKILFLPSMTIIKCIFLSP